MLGGRSKLPKPDWRHQLMGCYRATKLGLKRHYKLRFSRSHITPQFQRHRYPETSLEEVRARVVRFQQVLGDTSELKLEQIVNQIYHISAWLKVEQLQCSGQASSPSQDIQYVEIISLDTGEIILLQSASLRRNYYHKSRLWLFPNNFLMNLLHNPYDSKL